MYVRYCFLTTLFLAVVRTLVLEFKVNPKRTPTVTVDNINTCLRRLVEALQGSSTN
jgi:hypothetical protein